MSISAVNSVPVLAAGSVGAKKPAEAPPAPVKHANSAPSEKPAPKAAPAPHTGKVVDKHS